MKFENASTCNEAYQAVKTLILADKSASEQAQAWKTI